MDSAAKKLTEILNRQLGAVAQLSCSVVANSLEELWEEGLCTVSTAIQPPYGSYTLTGTLRVRKDSVLASERILEERLRTFLAEHLDISDVDICVGWLHPLRGG